MSSFTDLYRGFGSLSLRHTIHAVSIVAEVVQHSVARLSAGQKIGDRITFFAAALETASDGEEQTQTSPEDGP
jgi:hypothetical protein